MHEESARVPLHNIDTQELDVVTLRSVSIRSPAKNNMIDQDSNMAQDSQLSNPKIDPICSFVDYEEELVEKS